MLRKLIIAATLLALHAAVAAQTPDGAPLNTAKEFAQMKLNKEYLSEESTTQDPRHALENADLLLINRVNEYLAANHPGTPLSPAVLAGIKHLRMLRGDHTRVLSYISIAEITGGAPPPPGRAPPPGAPGPPPPPKPPPWPPRLRPQPQSRLQPLPCTRRKPSEQARKPQLPPLPLPQLLPQLPPRRGLSSAASFSEPSRPRLPPPSRSGSSR